MSYPSNLDPRAVANGILLMGKRRGVPLSNLAIQKLLYFAHASYLARYRVPLVRGVFEAWEYGPVCRAVYTELRDYGRAPVTNPIKGRDPFSSARSEISPPCEPVVCDHLDDIVRSLGALAPSQLVRISHAKGGPWEYVWNKCATEPIVGNRISDRITAERFAYLKVMLREADCLGDIDEAAPPSGD